MKIEIDLDDAKFAAALARQLADNLFYLVRSDAVQSRIRAAAVAYVTDERITAAIGPVVDAAIGSELKRAAVAVLRKRREATEAQARAAIEAQKGGAA